MARKKQSLGDMLRERIQKRIDSGENLTALAAAAGMKQPRLYVFLYEQSDIRLSNVERLLDVLGLEVVQRKGGA
jgi:DNA-binding phage protein